MDDDMLHKAPKVLLHDHLDGGLRPSTIAELAAEVGHHLPIEDPGELDAWFDRGGRGGDLVAYLEPFVHTVAVMQRADAIRRVARECAQDLDADGVVYAEVRFAPELSTAAGLDLDEVFDAVAEGLDAGPSTIDVRMLACIMRHEQRGDAVVAAAVRARDRGVPVVGVDLAGPEAGFGVWAHASAIATAADAGLGITLHAGEAAGPDSIAEALDHGAQRIGHGVRLIEDFDADGHPGAVARRVLAASTVLELCPTSNTHTGVVAGPADHPIERLRRLGCRVTVNTDNRLMSGVRLTDEFRGLVDTFGWELDDVQAATLDAVKAAFVDGADRSELTERVTRGFAALRP